MTEPERTDDRKWRKLFTFILPNEQEMTREEVQAELRHLGIDTRPGLARVQQALARSAKSRQARADLEAAKAERPSLLARIANKSASLGALTKDKLRDMIEKEFSGQPKQQAAFFRKLESTSSEEDLKSLLDDMAKLDALDEDPGDVGR